MRVEKVRMFFNRSKKVEVDEHASRVDLYRAFLDCKIVAQNQALDRLRHLETRASWLLASFLLVFNIEYLKYSGEDHTVLFICLLISTGILATSPLLYVIYPKKLDATEDFDYLLNQITDAPGVRPDNEDTVRFLQGGADYIDGSIDDHNRKARIASSIILISASLFTLNLAIVVMSIFCKEM